MPISLKRDFPGSCHHVSNTPILYCLTYLLRKSDHVALSRYPRHIDDTESDVKGVTLEAVSRTKLDIDA
jgi:hypothetical protein